MLRMSEKYPALLIRSGKFQDRGAFEEVRDLTSSLERFRMDVVKAINTIDDIRTTSASPVGSLVPLYIGEEVLDTVASPKKWYKSTGLTNADWVAIS